MKEKSSGRLFWVVAASWYCRQVVDGHINKKIATKSLVDSWPFSRFLFFWLKRYVLRVALVSSRYLG